MNHAIEPLTFTVSLALEAHAKAEQFRRQQSSPKKAKQVYFNTLAVYAVSFYLQCLEFETDLQKSDSWNPLMRTLMDVADLEVKNCGKLECRPVLPDSQVCHVPPEVCSERIGYVAVQLSESLKEANLLGFVSQVTTQNLPLSELRSLEELPEYLHQIQQQQVEAEKQPTSTVTSDILPVNLSQWFKNLFEVGWQSLETVLGQEQVNLAFGLRSASSVSGKSVKRAKLIDLGLQLGSQAAVLLVAIAPDTEEKVGILVQVHPVRGETYLPPNLRLALLSDSGETLQEVESRRQDNYIQLKPFRGKPGESFNLQVACGDVKMKEAFAI
jgi:hypothetical protein